MKTTLLTLLSTSALCLAADPPAKEPAPLFSDDFERTELGDAWQTVIPTFTVAGGVLKGSQTRADHGAVGAVKVAMKDGVTEFKFRLGDASTFNAVWDDKAYKGSHAGHICRVAVTPRQIRLGDDKEGVMRNDIFEMRKDPQRKAEAEKLLAGRGTAIPAKIEPGRWYQMRIEIAGETMRVSVDGKVIGSLQSPGIAHPTKSRFHFTVSGNEVLFDEVRIRGAETSGGN